MLKRFFVSMLGSLAAIWLTFMLLFLLVIVAAVGSIASALSSGSSVAKVEKNTILSLNLDNVIDERDSKPSFQDVIQGNTGGVSLENILTAIRSAADDKNIVGLLIECDGATGGFASRYEIVEAIKRFKESGKWVIAYGDNITQGDYYVASQADQIYLNPEGAVQISGLTSQIMFYTGLLEKLGVEMQITKVGTYKSAVEPFILKSISEPNREQMDLFLGSIWGNISTSMADARDINVGEINELADSLSLFSPAETFVQANLVDELLYRPEFEELLMEKVGAKDRDDINIISCEDYASLASDPLKKSSKNKIAVLYAYGEIVADGEEGITAGDLVPTIIDLAEDDDIEAVVFRVNSPGGSAFASEQIWHALNCLKESGKKLYVSMGDYAASGGYYISCNADKIFAAPSTLTGSIGVFGMIPNLKGLVTDKLGVNVDYVSTNPAGQLPDTFQPLTPFQRRKIQQSIDRIYDQFTSHVAEGRHLPIDSVKAIAEGRVWDGLTAKKIGLVDEIGTLEMTIKALADDMGYEKFEVVSYPDLEPSFWDFISKMGTDIKVSIIRSELGDTYPLYKEIQRVKALDPIQMRMESIVVE